MKRVILFLWMACAALLLSAQQYSGMSGLIHTPSADMDKVGDARIGTHWLNKHFLPDTFDYNGKYHSMDFYASLTPFSWLELGYTFTLRKGSRGDAGPNDIGYSHKDQYFSFKAQLLKEKKWYPSIAIGTNDPKTNGDKKENAREENRNQHFGNYYIAASKHTNLGRQEIGVHLAYRRFIRTYNYKWNGIVGGLTLRPHFYKPLRFIAEYTGEDMNIGADCLLWKHLLIQASLQNGKYFSGGVCFRMNLF